MIGIKQKAKKMCIDKDELNGRVRRVLSELSALVGATLGPGGRHILLDRPDMEFPLVTKDGVTVANSVSYEDSLDYNIAQAAKEACQRTNQEAGDGTTTAIVLSSAIVEEGSKFLKEADGVSPQQFCRDLERVAEEIISILEDNRYPLNNDEDLLHRVAMIACNGDADVADVVIEAIMQIGENGVVITEEGRSSKTELEVREGMSVDRGFSRLRGVAGFFIDPTTHELSFESPNVIIYDGEFSDPKILNDFLQKVVEKEQKLYGNRNPYIVVAHGFSSQTLGWLGINNQNNYLKIVPFESWAVGAHDANQQFLYDLAAFCNARVFNGIESHPDFLLNGDLEDLGQVSRFKMKRYSTVFIGPYDDEDSPAETRLGEYIAKLKERFETAESGLDKEFLRERIGNLIGGIATVYVGGNSILEMKEKRDRVEDCVNAVRSSIEKGVVPGGGATLLCISDYLESRTDVLPEYKGAKQVLCAALKQPFIRILSNAGYNKNERNKIADEILVAKEADSILSPLTYDSLNRKIVEPIDGGIVDPVKVTISAVRNAVSISKILMTLGGIVYLPRDSSLETQAELQAASQAQMMEGA